MSIDQFKGGTVMSKLDENRKSGIPKPTTMN